ncbi:MAG: UDP-3-O-acyl-N-acetylglucosamine deacetylase [Candidatus Aminicenantes bacterium]|nr:UDP-3-O-acyl-N-acetylglucosamine deacetylase [Candidatus Aminicenantes bacterium]
MSSMGSNKQTLQGEARWTGTGVHTGRPVHLRLKPSTAGAVIFYRTDLNGLELRLDPAAAVARHCTLVVRPEGSVQTIEHLLAALRMAGIDSAAVEIDAEEVPILDGSARPFVETLMAIGLAALPQKRTHLQILKPFRLQDKEAFVSFEPCPGFKISYAIDFPHPLIGRQELSLELTPESFASEIAPARTFGFMKDVEKLRSLGLARGASTDNTLVFNEAAVLNPPLRFPDEPVRHKILDLIGDLAVAGAPFLGQIRAEKAGHSLHLRALQSLLRSRASWTWAE